MTDDYDESLRLFELGRYRMQCGEYEDAISLFNRSVELHPHFKTLELLGECYLTTGRPLAAIVPLAAATSLNRGVRAPALLAESFYEAGWLSEAASAAEIALSRDERNKMAKQVMKKLEGGVAD